MVVFSEPHYLYGPFYQCVWTFLFTLMPSQSGNPVRRKLDVFNTASVSEELERVSELGGGFLCSELVVWRVDAELAAL